MNKLDYIDVLKALGEIPFPVGKKLLISFLRGDDHDSIIRNKLDDCASFGALGGYSRDEIAEIFDRLSFNGFVELSSVPGKKFWKVYQLTSLGREEMKNPTLHRKQLKSRYAYAVSSITEEDRALFTAFDFFLSPYNNEQKKAILSRNKRVLCVAGAGTGKTTTLTKRIEFLIRYKSILPQKILAITFTRKARQEMRLRLKKAGVTDVAVHTFNSFCEQLLQQYAHIFYGKVIKVLTLTRKIHFFQQALQNLGKTIEQAVDLYYAPAQRRFKLEQELFFGLLHDCYTVLEHYKVDGKVLEPFPVHNGLSVRERASAKMVYEICSSIHDMMVKYGFRDYADQLVHTLQLFQLRPDVIPQYNHVLIDEYQDVNEIQMKLIAALQAENLFCVGDPRQSIFGWRGSKVKYILDFQRRYPGSSVISLVKNYRSSPVVVDFINASIASMNLPALESGVSDDGKVELLSCSNETAEFDIVGQEILKSVVPRNEIFVLARTNRQLKEMSGRMKLLNIAHIVRSDEKKPRSATANDVVLATIHAIKGMEAHTVFVIGCSGQNFPCKAGDHPIVDLVKEVDYDKVEEERRLFYVALSRAKKRLVLTHYGSVTRFVTDEMNTLLGKGKQVKLKKSRLKVQRNGSGDAFDRLRSWRSELARELEVPPYIIFHDKVLLEIAARKPGSLDELQDIKGVGPSKLMKYGETVLGLL